MPRVFAVGYHGDGQLGEVDADEVDGLCAYEPVEVKGAPINIDMIACGYRHTLFLTKEGQVYSVGNNECGQLGRDQYHDESFEIKKIELKSTINIVQIACGQFHSAAVANDGRFFMWGANHVSQCGLNPCTKITIPERISVLVNIVQVACGESTTIVLTESCNVFVFGLINNQPQLPIEIVYLSCLPIIQIAGGGSHFAAVTASGQLFSWGENSNGQTGNTKTNDYSLNPKAIKNLNKVVYVACGLKHTVALTKSGQVFTVGMNSHGQLGDKNKDDITQPKAVVDLLGSTISSIACGNRYTIAVSNGFVNGFGMNNTGQLGISQNKKAYTPMRIPKLGGVVAAACGYEHTYFIVDDMADPKNYPIRASEIYQTPKFLTFERIRQLLAVNDKDGIINEIESVFSSVGCINGSFLYEDDKRYDQNLVYGLKLDDVMYAMNALEESTSGNDYVRLIRSSLEMCDIFEFQKILESRKLSLNEEMFKIFFILSWIPQKNNIDKQFMNFMKEYAILLSKIVEKYDNVFIQWWKSLPTRHFNRFNKKLMTVLEHLFPSNSNNVDVLKPLLSLIKRLSEVNKVVEKIPYDHFYLNCLEPLVNVRFDYVKYYLYKNPRFTIDGIQIPRGPDPFFWLNYPFLMNVIAKSNILETHSKVLQHNAMQRSYEQDMMFDLLAGPLFTDPFLHFDVSRSNLVQDTVTQMQLRGQIQEDFFKPLKVKFENEEGEDEGGVRKEYFMLLFKELLQPTYGMFSEDEESHYIWFTGFPVEKEHFTMVGTLCAMAIYNSILVELPFPLALYKYLLGVPFTIEDMRELHPTEARSLDAIMEYPEDDLQDVFMLSFNIPITIFGHTNEVDLKPNGKNIPLTIENRAEFVDLYIKKRMEYGPDNVLKDQLDAFKKGFSKLFDGTILSLFQPRELMELTAGNENYNWDELKENCKYKDKYHKDHPTIKAFWAAFNELTDDEKKNFLLFLMGTSRIPWKGMSKVEMVIQPTDPTKLPVAHTCFNLLDLPSIESKDELLKRLRICIANNQGFTLA